MRLKQLLKWIGNKQRFSAEIVSFFPDKINTYYEPFLGSGAVLGTLSASKYKRYNKAIVGDIIEPLIGIFELVKNEPEILIKHYDDCLNQYSLNRDEAYNQIKDRFNKNPNPLDFAFLSRSCYSGVVRFRKSDGYMSTPIGPHQPISAHEFQRRVYDWRYLIRNVDFLVADYRELMSHAQTGDLVYCDPPYTHSQSILYGSQLFRIDDLWEEIHNCKLRGAKVALSLNGNRRHKVQDARIKIPEELFERRIYVNCGLSMINRLQKNGESVDGDNVHDLLLLTW